MCNVNDLADVVIKEIGNLPQIAPDESNDFYRGAMWGMSWTVVKAVNISEYYNIKDKQE